MKLLGYGNPSTDRRVDAVDVCKTPMKSNSRRSVVDVPLKGEVSVDGNTSLGEL
jgi:hypothetical protein